ncbi:MAG: lipoprotein [Phycisphaerales bacterium]|nr:MAG: lipoprotein [Phycisphaerales bacterium]
MIFLAPLAGLVAAALAVPAVLALYLLKLRRRPVRVSTVLFWERAVRDAQGNAPWRMLRPQAQLLLQLLGLALLLMALARPALPSPLGGRVMLVLDRSASMNATDSQLPGTRFDQAKAQAGELIDRLRRQPGTRLMIVGLAGEALPMTPWTLDRPTLRGALDAAKATDAPASSDALAELVRLAALGQDDPGQDDPGQPLPPEEPREATQAGDAGPLTVVLVSDGDLPAPKDPLPANVTLRLEPVGPAEDAQPSNAGIVALAARRLYEDPASVRVFVRVQAVGAMRRELPVALALDGTIIDQAVADLAPRNGRPGPTQASVSLSATTVQAGVLSVLLPGGDDLASDDTASLWLREAGRPRVLLVIPDGELVDPNRPGPVMLIAAVLQSMELGELRVVRLSRYEQLAAEGSLPFDVAVFDRVAPRSAPPMPSLHFGPPPPLPEGVPALPTVEPGRLPPTPVVAWRRTHPVMRELALDQLAVAQPLIAPPDGPLPAAGGAVVLASGQQGPLILAYDALEHRRIWVGFEPAMSNWPTLVSFALFIAEAVDYLAMRGTQDAASSVRAGEMATLVLAEPRQTIRLTGPQGVIEIRSPRPTTRPTIGPLDRAGLYLLEDPRPGDQRALAVNLASERESRLGVARSLPAGFGGRGSDQPDAAQTGGQRELWPWFVLAGLAVLTLEWLASARALRR